MVLYVFLANRCSVAPSLQPWGQVQKNGKPSLVSSGNSTSTITGKLGVSPVLQQTVSINLGPIFLEDNVASCVSSGDLIRARTSNSPEIRHKFGHLPEHLPPSLGLPVPQPQHSLVLHLQ